MAEARHASPRVLVAGPREEMTVSSKNNVNPDHYKVAGRLKQGENVNQQDDRQLLKRFEERQARQNEAPVPESVGSDSDSEPERPEEQPKD
jgi:hypothetical protein